MFTRVFWFTTGAVAGAGGTVWAAMRVRRSAARFTPDGLAHELSGAVRQLGADLRAAAAEGRTGMREAELRLRAELEPSRWATPPGGSAPIGRLGRS